MVLGLPSGSYAQVGPGAAAGWLADWLCTALASTARTLDAAAGAGQPLLCCSVPKGWRGPGPPLSLQPAPPAPTPPKPCSVCAPST